MGRHTLVKFLKTLKPHLLHWPRPPTSGCWYSGNKISVRKKCWNSHAHGSSVQSCVIRSKARCPSKDESVKITCCICTREYYAAMKTNKILTFASKWVELEIIALSKINQLQKGECSVLSLPCGSQQEQKVDLKLKWWFLETGKDGERNREKLFQWHQNTGGSNSLVQHRWVETGGRGFCAVQRIVEDLVGALHWGRVGQ